MDFLRLGTALLLLIVPGGLLAFLIVSRASVSRPALTAGYGLIFGLIGIPLLMRLIASMGFSMSYAVTGSSVAVVTLMLVVVVMRLGGSLIDGQRSRLEPTVISARDLCVLLFLLAIIVIRVSSLAADVVWRPLFPWDATMHWATKARVWFEYLELRPFVENSDWLISSDPAVFTDHHPAYPITIPLLQLWITSALDRWDESLMNLPWLLCVIGLGAAFYGQAREAKAGPILSLAFTYFLLSMPLLNTHVALAGYADLFLGTSYCLAIMAFHNWSVERQTSQGLLAVLFAVGCVLIKNEGIFWLLTFLPALLVVLVPGRKALLGLLAVAITAAVILAVFPRDLVFAGHSLNELKLFYRPGAGRAVFESFFMHDSWHLFAYLLCGVIASALVFRRSTINQYKGIAVALASAAGLFLFLFVFTAYSGGALGFTAVGRISLQLVPAFMFFCLLLSRELLQPTFERSAAP